MQSLGIDVKVELTQVVQSHLVGGWNTVRLNIARTLEASDIGSVVLCISGKVRTNRRKFRAVRGLGKPWPPLLLYNVVIPSARLHASDL